MSRITASPSPARPEQRSFGRDRKLKYQSFFAEDSTSVWCTDIRGLLLKLGYDPSPEDWRLFIDGASGSVRIFLLSNGSKYSPVPLAVQKGAESYPVCQELLSKIGYRSFNFRISADLKCSAILAGLMAGYPSYPCPWCEWPSRRSEVHYKKRVFPVRKNIIDPTKSQV